MNAAQKSSGWGAHKLSAKEDENEIDACLTKQEEHDAHSVLFVPYGHLVG
jgi:hypothetical protein